MQGRIWYVPNGCRLRLDETKSFIGSEEEGAILPTECVWKPYGTTQGSAKVVLTQCSYWLAIKIVKSIVRIKIIVSQILIDRSMKLFVS